MKEKEISQKKRNKQKKKETVLFLFLGLLEFLVGFFSFSSTWEMGSDV